MTVNHLKSALYELGEDIQIYYRQDGQLVELGSIKLVKWEGNGPRIVLLSPDPEPET